MIKKKQRIEMDSNFFRKRDHQQVEMIRQQNFRDNHHLLDILYSGRTGLVAKRNQEIKEVSKSQQKIWQELKSIHKSTTGRLADIENEESVESAEETLTTDRLQKVNFKTSATSSSREAQEENGDDSNKQQSFMKLVTQVWTDKRSIFDRLSETAQKKKRKNLLAASLRMRVRDTPYNKKLPSLESMFFRQEKQKAASKIKAENQKYDAYVQKFNAVFPEKAFDDDFVSNMTSNETNDLRDSTVVQSAPGQLQEVNSFKKEGYLQPKGMLSLRNIDLNKVRDSVKKRLGVQENSVQNTVNFTEPSMKSKGIRLTPGKLLPPGNIKEGVQKSSLVNKQTELTKGRLENSSTNEVFLQSDGAVTQGKGNSQPNGDQPSSSGRSNEINTKNENNRKKQSSEISTQPSGIPKQPLGIPKQPLGILKQPSGKSQVSGIITQPGKSPGNRVRRNSLAVKTSQTPKTLLMRHVITKPPIVAKKPELTAIRESKRSSIVSTVSTTKSDDFSQKAHQPNTKSVIPEIMVQDFGASDDGYIQGDLVDGKDIRENHVNERTGGSEGVPDGASDNSVSKNHTETNKDRLGEKNEEAGNKKDDSDTVQKTQTSVINKEDADDINELSKTAKILQNSEDTKEIHSDLNNTEIKNFADSSSKEVKDEEPSEEKEAKKKKKKKKERILSYDPKTQNPDGMPRTVYSLPEFQESLDEALKARYLRSSYKQWYEKELSTSEVFTQLKKPETSVEECEEEDS